jgi:DNA-binding MarR family transcriptional regulator
LEQDFVRSLGLAFLAHRLKRASETILEGSTEALRRHGFGSPARSGSTLLLLRENGPSGITEIAWRLRLSHPLIIKLAAAMAAAGLVRDERDPVDHRRRLIALTEKGLAEAERIDAFSRALERTFAAMFVEAEADLFDALERFEAAAQAWPLADRLEAALSEGEMT